MQAVRREPSAEAQVRGGPIELILLLGTVACLPLSLADSRWLIGSAALYSVVLLGAWLGRLWGQTRMPGWLVALLGFLTGIEWNALTLGHLLPGWGVTWRELAHAVRWLSAGLRGTWTTDIPFLPLLPDVWARALALGQRLGAWSQAGMAGTVSRDSLVLLLFVAILAWWISYYAGWQLARGRSALAAFLPLGIAILSNVALTYGRGMAWLRVFLGGALLLMVFSRFTHLERRWQREGLDYSRDLQGGTRFVGVGLTAVLLVVALLVPYITWQQTVSFFWRYAYKPWTEVSRRMDRLFAGRNPVPQPTARAGMEGGSGHELSGRPGVGQDVVFYVTTSDPPPELPELRERRGEQGYEGPQHYWREVTYDTYTGRGWENGSLERADQTPGTPLERVEYPHTVLTQTFMLQLPAMGLVPAANDPAVVDRAYTVVRRTVSDTVGFETGAIAYTVVSHVPAPTQLQLSVAGTDYPPDIAARYLALPEVPRRVRDLALEVTAQARNPYGKAQAVQEHLRSYDYDLEVPPPPPNTDVADYLLYQTRRGYCDYYATAMVVMLRAAGVPARYASGYAMGAYDYTRKAYRVTQRDAHAWVEVYFPGFGWVEFEPTPYRTAFTRPVGGTIEPLPVVTPAPVGAQGWLSRWPWANKALSYVVAALVAVAALGGVFLAIVLTLRSGRRFSSGLLALQLYGRMLRSAERVNLGPERGDTPLEFTARLGRALEERGTWAEGAAEEARLIGSAYVRARFASSPLSAREAGQALTAWEKLRGKLRWLYFWRR